MRHKSKRFAKAHLDALIGVGDGGVGVRGGRGVGEVEAEEEGDGDGEEAEGHEEEEGEEPVALPEGDIGVRAAAWAAARVSVAGWG